MIKVKCSKYPYEKCEHMENGTYNPCIKCGHNMYQELLWNTITFNNFKPVKEELIVNIKDDIKGAI